ncbi:hypothetical protein ACL03H_17295 [Saccharopolyspora sp. MS10]|uniref:hypothetical protein n=1 Tax=Saccharopolyspora sp. MS10 TaxID=3385973 RepID=UPI0039A0B7B4
MRPAGVRQRLQELRDREREWIRARPRLALRRALTDFFHGCALLSCGDVSGSGLVEPYRKILTLWDEPTQHRTGSRFERLSFECIEQLRVCEPLAEVAAAPQRHAARDDAVESLLARIPPRVLVGRDTPEAHFPMACRNATGSLLDDVSTPYRASLLITSVGYFEPAEERELLAAMRTLRVRYEDQPDDRPATGEDITRELRAWFELRCR